MIYFSGESSCSFSLRLWDLKMNTNSVTIFRTALQRSRFEGDERVENQYLQCGTIVTLEQFWWGLFSVQNLQSLSLGRFEKLIHGDDSEEFLLWLMKLPADKFTDIIDTSNTQDTHKLMDDYYYYTTTCAETWYHNNMDVNRWSAEPRRHVVTHKMCARVAQAVFKKRSFDQAPNKCKQNNIHWLML